MATVILHIGQLITMAGPPRPRTGLEMSRLHEIHDGAMVIEEGNIKWVGTTDELPRLNYAEEIDASGRLVTPGFVDAHTHAIFADNRCHEFQWRSEGTTYQEIKERGGGIFSTVRATRHASEDDLLVESRRHLGWMLASGTTTLEVKSGYGLEPETELKMLRIADRLGPQRVVGTYLGAHAIPPEATSKAAYLETVLDTLPSASKIAKFCDIFVETGYFEPDDARKVMGTARTLGLKPRVHVDQFSDSGGAALAGELRALTADHLEHTGLEGIRALKRAGIFPVLLPASVYGLGLTKYPDARSMIDEDLPLVLATDFNPGSSPCPSIPVAMSLACTQMKMTPAEAMTAATINAAYSLELGDRIGSLEPGKAADFIVHDADDYREIPYWIGRETASTVSISGVEVYCQG